MLVVGRPTAEVLRRLRRGVTLDDGVTAPAEAWVAEETPDGTWLGVVLREGRKRQVRRMLDAVGHPVLALVRERMGPITLGGLAAGTARRITPEEVAALDALVAVPA